MKILFKEGMESSKKEYVTTQAARDAGTMARGNMRYENWSYV